MIEKPVRNPSIKGGKTVLKEKMGAIRAKWAIPSQTGRNQDKLDNKMKRLHAGAVGRVSD